MPTYNGEKYLREQLDSIYQQTLLPDEVIVVDDCSKDGTIAILDEYKEKYGLKYYINEQNLGYNRNFEKGIHLANGDYICLCDQDDVWYPNKIERLFNKIQEIENNEPACVSSGIDVYDNNSQIIVKRPIGKDHSGDSPLYLYESQGCTLIFNRKLVEQMGEIPAEMMFDFYIGTISILLGNRYHIAEPLMSYRIHGKNAVGCDLIAYSKHKFEGRQLSQLIISGVRLVKFHQLENCMNINSYKEEILNRAIRLFSKKNGTGCIFNIIRMPYYSILDKFWTLMFYFGHRVKMSK